MCLLLFRSLGLLFHVMAMVTDQSELSGVVFSIGADEDLVLGEEKVLAVMGRHAGRSLQKCPCTAVWMTWAANLITLLSALKNREQEMVLVRSCPWIFIWHEWFLSISLYFLHYLKQWGNRLKHILWNLNFLVGWRAGRFFTIWINELREREHPWVPSELDKLTVIHFKITIK